MPAKVTAKTFQPHLLTVLGALAGYRANKPFPRDKVIEAVLAEMNLSPDAYGEKNGKLVTHTQIGLAFRAARTLTTPLTSSPKKGQWALTKEGAAEAKLLAEVEEEEEPELVVEEPSEARPYRDQHLLDLAQSQTRCFGWLHDPRDDTCRACPLEGTCEPATYEQLRKAEEELEIEELQQTATPEPPKPKGKKRKKAEPLDWNAMADGGIDLDDALADPSRFTAGLDALIKQLDLADEDFRGAKPISVGTGVVLNCHVCGKDLKATEPAMFVRNKGSFHEDCFSSLKAQHNTKGATK